MPNYLRHKLIFNAAAATTTTTTTTTGIFVKFISLTDKNKINRLK